MDTIDNKEKVFDAERIVNIVIAILGFVIMLLGALLFHKPRLSTVLISVGASMVASAIVAFLSSVYIRQYRHAKELTEYWGLSSIEDKRAIMNYRIARIMNDTKLNYDLIAFGLKSLREGNPQGVSALLQRGAKIRIITVDPNTKALEERDIEENEIVGHTADTIRQLIKWVENLSGQYPNQCEIRLARFLPTEYYCREDNYIYVGPYQHGKNSQQTITTEFKKGGQGFEYYEQYFEKLWNDPEYCSQLGQHK